MPNANDIRWLKGQFSTQISAAVANTPFSLDLVVAIACQETGFIWGPLQRQGVPTARILKLCVGDTIDGKPNGKGRKPFPRSRAELEGHANGTAMFAVARQALIDMAAVVPGYTSVAQNPNKFCHAFGIFQYDLQFFDLDVPYFSQGGYAEFPRSLKKCVTELIAAQKRTLLKGKTVLTDREQVSVGIAYNRGSYNPNLGLKQGHFDGEHYYGENLMSYLNLAKTVPTPPAASTAISLRIMTDGGTLNLRQTPDKSSDANILARLPDDHPVKAVSATAIAGFREIDSVFQGRALHGFVWNANLEPA